MKLILLCLLTFFICSCKPVEQRVTEEFLYKTVNLSLENDVPYHDFLKAETICSKHPAYDNCELVTKKIHDISVSYTSCLYDQRSKLCKMIVDEIRNTSLYLMLPKTDALVLPSIPFYWSLPTDLLDAQSSRYEYRDETIGWLWEKLKYFVIATCMVFIVGVFYLSFNLCVRHIQRRKENENEILKARQYEIEEN